MLTPNPNGCNSTLMSGTMGIYPHHYILMLMSGVIGYELSVGGGARAGVPRPVWTVSISGSGLAWASLGMGGLQGFGTFSCFAVGRTTVPLFGTPNISTLFKV